MIKILIEIEGGIVQAVSASEEIVYVVVDLDHSEYEEIAWESELVPRKQDSIYDKMYKGFEPLNNGEPEHIAERSAQIYQALKNIDF